MLASTCSPWGFQIGLTPTSRKLLGCAGPAAIHTPGATTRHTARASISRAPSAAAAAVAAPAPPKGAVLTPDTFPVARPRVPDRVPMDPSTPAEELLGRIPFDFPEGSPFAWRLDPTLAGARDVQVQAWVSHCKGEVLRQGDASEGRAKGKGKKPRGKKARGKKSSCYDDKVVATCLLLLWSRSWKGREVTSFDDVRAVVLEEWGSLFSGLKTKRPCDKTLAKWAEGPGDSTFPRCPDPSVPASSHLSPSATHHASPGCFAGPGAVPTPAFQFPPFSSMVSPGVPERGFLRPSTPPSEELEARIRNDIPARGPFSRKVDPALASARDLQVQAWVSHRQALMRQSGWKPVWGYGHYRPEIRATCLLLMWSQSWKGERVTTYKRVREVLGEIWGPIYADFQSTGPCNKTMANWTKGPRDSTFPAQEPPPLHVSPYPCSEGLEPFSQGLSAVATAMGAVAVHLHMARARSHFPEGEGNPCDSVKRDPDLPSTWVAEGEAWGSQWKGDVLRQGGPGESGDVSMWGHGILYPPALQAPASWEEWASVHAGIETEGP